MQPEHPARPLFAGNASPGPALRDRVFALAPANTAQSEKLVVHFSTKSLFSGLGGGGAGGGLEVTGLGAEQRPDEAAEFAGDGYFSLVALQPSGEQPGKAQVQAVLGFPRKGAHLRRLAFLAAGQFLADFGRREVVLSTLG